MLFAESASSARSAVGAIALAALAVSAMAFTTEPEPEYFVANDEFALDCFHDPATTIGDIVVVGTDEYEQVVAALEDVTTELSHCTTQAMRITVYAHLEAGVASAIEVQGDDVPTTDCVRDLFARSRFAVDTPVDVMVPVDLVPPLDR